LQKCVEMTETSWKNSFIIAKHAWIRHANFIVIAITISENNEGITFVLPLVSHMLPYT
jgi:hypothetical protein